MIVPLRQRIHEKLLIQKCYFLELQINNVMKEARLRPGINQRKLFFFRHFNIDIEYNERLLLDFFCKGVTCNDNTGNTAGTKVHDTADKHRTIRQVQSKHCILVWWTNYYSRLHANNFIKIICVLGPLE